MAVTTIDEVWRYSGIIVAGGLAPKSMDTQQKVFLAICAGAEIGIPPMQSLRAFYVVNNRVTIWGDSMIDKVRSSGNCKYIKEWIEGDGDSMVAWCEGCRIDTGEIAIRSFTAAEAKQANLWAKSIWVQYRRRMMQMRARSYLIRDLFTDAINSMPMAEEVMDYNDSPVKLIDNRPKYRLSGPEDQAEDCGTSSD